jgi:hypothetical protein
MPLTAAIVITDERSHSRPSAWIFSRWSRPESMSQDVNALMSAPAQNSVGFGEASTIARAPRPTRSSQAVRNASMTAGAREFAGGLSSQITATSPRMSSFTAAVS